MPAPLLVADAPYLLYRSFFALPDSIRGRDDNPVNALLGCANALLRIVADFKPRAVVLCFGAEAAKYRVELYPPYHAHRPPVPDALAWQFANASELFTGFGWLCQSSDDYEADDLLGSYAEQEAAAGGQTLILTGDRDMYQCASPTATVLYLKAGSGVEQVDAEEVRRRYGITPDLVPDFIALRGDPSDGLPGAPGIGEKTAGDLLRRHGSLEDVIAASADERPKIGMALRQHADELRAFKEIARLRAVPLDRPPDAMTDLRGGAASAERFGMGQLAGRLGQAQSLADL